ncbi:MAG: hypothetical protein IT204_22185 [Fimbriimonadaceae bacterium]|nr:hypothetical protein [Fimbriimonadaceae bacterium]
MPETPNRRQFVAAAAGGLALLAVAAADPCQHCAAPCLTVCPERVAIPTVLRRRQDPAAWAALPAELRRGLACGECNLCSGACPAGLAVSLAVLQAGG